MVMARAELVPWFAPSVGNATQVISVVGVGGSKAKVDVYERRNQSRTTVLNRISSLRGNEPWPGYDELTAADVQAVLSEGDDTRAADVRSYERAHKNRAGVLKAAEREHANA